MRLLFIGWNPKAPNPGGELMKRMITFSEGLGHEVFVLYCDSIDETYMVGHATVISFLIEARDRSPRTYFQKHHFRGFISFILAKVERRFSHGSSDGKYWGKRIEELHKQNKFDCVLSLADNLLADVVALFYCSIRHKAVYFIEPPLLFPQKNKTAAFLQNTTVNKRVLRRLYHSDIHIYYPPCWKSFFVTYARGVWGQEIDFPMLTFHRPKEVFNGNLIYLGRFYQDIRNPQKLFDLMKMLKGYRLHVFGLNEKQRKLYDCPNNVIFHKPVSIDKLMEEISSCTALVNIENNGSIYESSKDITYFGFRKPILSFGHKERLIREYSEYGQFFDALERNGELKPLNIIESWLANARNSQILETSATFEKYTVPYFVEKLLSSF